jgi:capsular polysaccharide biosynthesis protein
VTLSEYVDALRRGWIIIVATTVLILAAGAAHVLRQPDVYTSSTELFVSPDSTGGDPDLVAQRAAIAANRVKSYVPVAQGDVVREQVDEAVDGLGDASVSVVVPLDTVALSIIVTSADPDNAADVATAYAEVVTDVIEEIETPADGEAQVKVTTIDRADVPSAPAPIAVFPVLGAAGIFGLGLGVTLAVLREVVRRERSRRPRGTTSTGDV